MEMELTESRTQESNNLEGNNGEFMAMEQFVPSEWNLDYICLDNLLQEDDNNDHTFSSLMDLISQPPPLLHQPPQPSIPSAFDNPFLETFQDVIESSYCPPLMLPASQGDNNNNSAPLKKSNKKVQGQPSKNLMAERRRRKRLNDRLSMLRPFSFLFMDRTSILADAIDYMKELLDKINKLQKLGSNYHLKENVTTNESTVRNSPKFEVDQMEINTHIDICCSTKPGLLLSTVSTLEILGLEIQQCVISCFGDFSLQASCSEVAEQRGFVTSEDIKQALFKNAGYGGRC
ncbi:hypothetical protein EUTSA_v10016038mg [Eutrema salsugineum]|uniref:BHLH domain-containing protein n=1 Tax=Eutrema salsugineum TaxID=72664 RepID=V4LMG9_EUTSA|nr:hypothetical protein EUTSA_v10016038mg [Eutrema salsugineum]